jgi:hypothetical protein
MAQKVRSLYILNAVRRLSDAHVKSLHILANSREFDVLKEAVKNIEHNTMVSFFNLDHSRDPGFLAQEGAFSKGIIFGLSTLMRIIEAVPEEVDKRESRKKRTTAK